MKKRIIKTKSIGDAKINLVFLTIDKRDRRKGDNHNHYFKIRVSENSHSYTYEETYIKKYALKLFDDACQQAIREVTLKKDYEKREKLFMQYCTGGCL